MASDHVERDALPEGAEPVPHGVRTMAALRWAILGLSALLAAAMWWSYVAGPGSGPSHSAQAARYHCPMHPQITSSEPGECPICHMTLEPIPAHRAASAASATSPASPASSAVAAPNGAPTGTTPITLSLDRIQAIGVRTAVVAPSNAAEPLRVSAVVAPAEGGAAEVHVRTTGFVERVLVTETGAQVRAAQPLLTFYSPEIYQAESELVVVSRWGSGDGHTGASAARRKLELLGMAPRDIDQVATTGELMRAIPVYAPQAGQVVKKSAVVGGYVTPEMVLYELQDFSRVYIVADVFPQDVRYLHKGAAGRFISARTGTPVDVRIDLIYPTVQAEARTTRVRMTMTNGKGAAFRPGEYGSVELMTPARTALTVPRDAVVDTGLATYVFVVQGEGNFAPRAVVLGAEQGDSLVVESGLVDGERVVAGATFLIDSESRLQAAARAAEGAQR